MQFQFLSRNFRLADEQKDYAERKIGHILHLAPRGEDDSTQVRIEIEKTTRPEDDRRFKCEVTAFLPGVVVRAEEDGATVEASVDGAEEKMRAQVERYKSKLHRRGKQGEWLPTSTLESIEDEHTAESKPKILKRKRYESTRGPMSEEEAIEQMELIGHDFFLFENADTGRFSVVYRRYTEGYGIVEPLGEGETKEED